MPNHYSTNQHILKLSTNIAEKEQIMSLIAEAIANCKSGFGPKYAPGYLFHYQVKIVGNNKGVKFGFAYVWFREVEVRNALLGFKLDGSSLIEYRDDPTWVEPPPKPIKSWQEMMDEALPTNWGDLTDLEEEENAKYICPKIKLESDPLTRIPPFVLAADQHQEYFDFMLSTAKWNETWYEGMKIELNTSINLVPEEVAIKEVDTDHSPNVLCATGIPDWVEEEDIMKIFINYVTDPKKICYVKDPRTKKSVRLTYPQVSITKGKRGNKMAFATFDPETRDAYFALLMTRRTDVTRGSHHATLYFDHALASGR